jgi:hypothetical protein
MEVGRDDGLISVPIAIDIGAIAALCDVYVAHFALLQTELPDATSAGSVPDQLRNGRIGDRVRRSERLTRNVLSQDGSRVSGAQTPVMTDQ